MVWQTDLAGVCMHSISRWSPLKFSRNWGCLFAPLMAVAFLSAANSAEPKCDDSLVPATNNPPYTKRQGRCEGFYATRENADPTLALIGYIKGLFFYNLSAGEVIKVKVSPGTPTDSGPISIRSQPYFLKSLYRMDSVMDRNETLKWPVKDVLLKGKIQPPHIGIHGSYLHKSDTAAEKYRVHVPLVISSQALRNKNDSLLRMYLRATQDTDNLRQYWQCTGGKSMNDEDWRERQSSEPIVVFPPNKFNGICFVRFEARIKKTESGVKDTYVKRELFVWLDQDN